MKNILIDDELYQYIASKTKYIGENASDILRRLLFLPQQQHNMFATNSSAVEKQQELQINQHADLLSLITSTRFLSEKKSVNRFLQLLSLLCLSDACQFADITKNLHGRKRQYFATSQQELLKNGENSRPKKIPQTSYWVITNTNSGRKILILKLLMEGMRVAPDIITQVVEGFSASGHK